ncbi:protein arginine methyltransferase NDUFAF7, mitochondrial-like isoform X2 [Penaeus japonicus]|uniref:protein arginine methyltransferase NDUFAF7, mitochondrial-like isoform X2 n=1 Tax=Penaeus japonicus TaxID=27405 RepID=UPI001C711BEB|nr:protein arginine methyltransferase NDUFAF7, mitochondrial-like isoform X2 [Penaeus japonicus]XP_042884330.1 protein arginine methyltransferase NDUFAF7, mitochondrial-like isoform X2 [Penaeus japonicus]
MGTLARFSRRLHYTCKTFLSPLQETRKEGVCFDVRASLSTTSRSYDTASGSDETGKQPNLSIIKTAETPLLKQLQARIKFSGPLTVYDYMKEGLINPLSGYYAAGQDMFGTKGDYVTSPEISQMFGEMVGVWIFNEWYKLGSLKPLQLVEFGPGRGTLMQDILRVLKQLGVKGRDLSIHFVEVSPELSQNQEERLCGSSQPYTETSDEGDFYKKNTTTGGTPVFWYRHLSSVPKRFSVFVAHEFFDVLPVHILRKTKDGWRELLVDVDEGDGPHHLRYVLSRTETPAAKLFVEPEETRDEVEVSPDGAVLCKDIAKRIEDNGGLALIMDYGHDGKLTDTFRAFKNHKQHHPLCEPGTADLTADVDFAYLKKQVQEDLITYGPVTQSFFLQNMGIEARLATLLKNSKPEEQKNLISAYKMLTDRHQMGERFKFLALFPGVVKNFLIKYPPAGFYRDFDE